MTTAPTLLAITTTSQQLLSATERSSKAEVFELFGRYESGILKYGELKSELTRLVKASYATSGSVAFAHMSEVRLVQQLEATEHEWSPLDKTVVLSGLLADINRNFMAFRDSSRDEKALRRLRFRSWLSVQTAIRRGFTDRQLEYATHLASQGHEMRKVWIANVGGDSIPCEHCLRLHGTNLPYDKEFSRGAENSPKVYRDLQGPNRHPNCRCHLVVYAETPSFTFEPVSASPGSWASKFMSSRDVRKLPRAAYTAVITTLRLIAGKLKGAVRGFR